MSVVRTGRAAGAWFRDQVGKAEYHLMCKAFVAAGFNAEPSTSPTAIAAWEQAEHKHPVHDPEKVPAFVPVFLDTSNAAEHVAATVGRDRTGHRLVVSTDAGPGGTVGLVRLADLMRWGPIIGWTEDINHQRVWTPQPIIALSNVRDAALHESDEKGDPPLHEHAVRVVERALVAERLLAPAFVNGRFGPRKRHAYALWQHRVGSDPTGVPTMVDLSRLGIRHGFDVR